MRWTSEVASLRPAWVGDKKVIVLQQSRVPDSTRKAKTEKGESLLCHQSRFGEPLTRAFSVIMRLWDTLSLTLKVRERVRKCVCVFSYSCLTLNRHRLKSQNVKHVSQTSLPAVVY